MGETLFSIAVAQVLKWEGGYVNDPRDPGGETNFGIAKRSHPDVDIGSLTREGAIAIYLKEYWTPLLELDLPRGTLLFALDTAVNCGLGRTKQWLADSHDLRKLAIHRSVHYALLDRIDDAYAGGWFNRLFDTYDLAKEENVGGE